MSRVQNTVPPLYCKGSTFPIAPHVPPSTADARQHAVSEEEERMLRAGHRADAVFKFPAPSTSTTRKANRHKTTPSQSLEILQSIACGLRRGPQIVLCTITPSGSAQAKPAAQYIAKVFDPMYYQMPDRPLPWLPPVSVNKQANVDYSREAAAYERISFNNASQPYPCTPEYFGSWSFWTEEDMDKPKSSTAESKSPVRTRQICLVLLECIRGHSMEDIVAVTHDTIDPDLYQKISETYRLKVWSQFLQAEAWLEFIGVQHRDLAIRNVMIEQPPIKNNDEATSLLRPRLVIIDFDVAELKQDSAERPGAQPTNPIVSWWSSPGNELTKWCPVWWLKNLPRRRQWLLEEFREDKRYQKVDSQYSLATV